MKAIVRFLWGMIVLALLGCVGVMLFAGKAHAQTIEVACVPAATAPKWAPCGVPAGQTSCVATLPPATTMAVSANASGVCAKWTCFREGSARVMIYCGPWSEQTKVGGRVNTIQKAKDPRKSLETLPTRVTVVPLSDPSMAGMPR